MSWAQDRVGTYCVRPIPRSVGRRGMLWSIVTETVDEALRRLAELRRTHAAQPGFEAGVNAAAGAVADMVHGAPPGIERIGETRSRLLNDVAAWLDEEYRLTAIVRRNTEGDGYDAHQVTGQLAVLAELAGLLRNWATTGSPPAHRPVRSSWRDAYEAEVRREQEREGVRRAG